MKLFGRRGIARRYRENQEAAKGFDTYIYGQTKAPVASLRYGSAGKELRDVGCGIAAVYNVMRFLGQPQPVADVINDAELLRLAFMGGRFGTKTKKLDRYFKLHGVPCQIYRRCSDFKQALDSHSIAIVCTWNNKITDGIHFYCLYRDSETGELTALNYYSADAPQTFLLDNLRDDRFIIGYGFNTNNKI